MCEHGRVGAKKRCCITLLEWSEQKDDGLHYVATGYGDALGCHNI